MSADPYKYFRIEARELIDGLSVGVLEIERGGPNKDVVGRLLRLAHTLKGAARVVRLPEIARHSHAVEDELAPFRDGQGAIPAERVTHLLGLIDQMGSELTALDGPKASAATTPPDGRKTGAAAAPRSNAEVPVETVRVDLEEMDLLLDGVTEATVQINSLEREGERLARARDLTNLLLEQLGAGQAEKGPSPAATLRAYALAEELGYILERVSRNVASSVEQVSRELGQVRDAANRFRLQPASAIFSSLERAARDAAQALGKRIAFRTKGGDGRIDAHVLSGIRDALSHVVRNAVAHGIEPEAQRIASGKPLIGEVTLTVERRGDRIAFTCQDDGRGIDVAGLRRAAVIAGAVGETESTRLSDADVFQLLLKGGLTTARALTEVSGRAVGLDAVRETVSRFNGQVSMRTEPGRGTSIEILLPVSLSSVLSLVVEADGVASAVPLDAVRRTLRVTDAEIARSADGDSIVHEGRVIPFISLARALRRPGVSTRRRLAWSAVVVAAGSSLAAVGVDRLLGTGTVVVRPLPARADIDGVVAGASLDAEGHPQLVLEPDGLVAAAQQARAVASEAQVRPRLPLLVVDDSLTTRMLEQSILESAGYEVDLATSAEQALEKAKARRYALFVVDVEMPGMDGFQFVATTRADPNLRETPAILVTSRGAPEDQRRGLDAGARAYIVKGEFDQGHLLKSIRDLIG